MLASTYSRTLQKILKTAVSHPVFMEILDKEPRTFFILKAFISELKHLLTLV
jgi:hypothetical protein